MRTLIGRDRTTSLPNCLQVVGRLLSNDDWPRVAVRLNKEYLVIFLRSPRRPALHVAGSESCFVHNWSLTCRLSPAPTTAQL